MRSLLHLALLGACAGAPSTPLPPGAPADGIRPVTDFAPEPRVQVWPKVELVPENALTFRITAADAQPLSGPEFTVYRVRGEQAVALPQTLPSWKWSEDVTQAIVEPVGLERGAPYLLVGEGLVGPGGAYATFAHRFRVVPPDTDPPDGGALELRGQPGPGSREPLVLTFPEPMREDVMHSVATLVDGVPQPTPWIIDETQRVLTFTPPRPWPEGQVYVSVGGSAKDLAGNPLKDPPGSPLRPTVPVETPSAPGHPADGGE